ncbi:MAG: DNA-binding transcriptional repressor ArsR [Methanoregula sp. PtaU1.Bin051]|nr:MAG: DNA-binding transcriptional repressor ArsR [Methanoregula sp. PtaU1.Bin051]
MDDQTEYIIDKSTIDILSSDTRVTILTSLRERKKTNAELSKELSLKPSTIHHHLERLKESGLIESKEDGRKWVYYDLSPFGKAIFNPDKKMTLSIIISSILTFITGLAAFYTYFTLPRLDSRPLFPVFDDPFFLMFIVAIVSLFGQIIIILLIVRRNNTRIKRE